MPMILIFTGTILFVLFAAGLVYIFAKGDDYHSRMKEEHRRRGWKIDNKDNKDKNGKQS